MHKILVLRSTTFVAFLLVLTTIILSVSCQKTGKKNVNAPADRVSEADNRSMADSLTKTTQTMNDFPLEQVKGWSPNQIARMKKSWITTAEQVVAISVTPNGIRSLAEQLQTTEDETHQLVKAAQQTLTADKRAELSQPADTSQYGLGARNPDEMNRR